MALLYIAHKNIKKETLCMLVPYKLLDALVIYKFFLRITLIQAKEYITK